jgi:hypothetical protein
MSAAFVQFISSNPLPNRATTGAGKTRGSSIPSSRLGRIREEGI